MEDYKSYTYNHCQTFSDSLTDRVIKYRQTYMSPNKRHKSLIYISDTVKGQTGLKRCNFPIKAIHHHNFI